MPTFTYLGMSDSEKESIANLQIKRNPLIPPEKRGMPPRYRITKEDEEEEKDAKRELSKRWRAARKKEILEGIEAGDKERAFLDTSKPGQEEPIVFKKGVPKFLPDDHPLVPKLMELSVGHQQKKRFVGHQIITHNQFKMEKGDATPKK